MQVRCFYSFSLYHHILIILVNEDGEDRWVAGDVGDELRVIDRHTISGNAIVLNHGRLRERRLK